MNTSNTESNKEFNTLINKLLNRELEELRKKFLPYKRKSFLKNKVVICMGEYKKDVAGYYENTRENDKQIRFTHKIYVTQNSISSYNFHCEWHMKRAAIRDLRLLIRHELIHAFVYEEFEMWESIKGMDRDYSPIYLSCLYWGNGVTHHKYANKFLETQLWKEIQECKKYDDVYIKLMKYIIKFEKCIGEINKEIKINKNNYAELNIEFNHREPGMLKRMYLSMNLKQKQDYSIYRYKATTMTLGLGFLVTPDILKESYQRKFDNGSLAQVHSEEVAFAKNDEIKHRSVIRDNTSCYDEHGDLRNEIKGKFKRNEFF